MSRPPVQSRGGHTQLPNALVASALASCTAPQFRLLIGLFFEAEFKREGTVTAAGWRVGFGQVLVSYQGLAERYGLTLKAVRCALAKFEQLGVTSGRASRGTGEGTDQGTPWGTPPTVVNLFGQGTPWGTEQGTGEGTVQDGKTGIQEEKTAAQAAPSKREKAPSPRHAVVVDLLVRVFSEALGQPYRVRGQSDGKAVKTLLGYPEATDAELARRARAFLADPFNAKNASFSLFASRWSSSGAPGAGRDLTRGRVAAEDCTNHGPAGTITNPFAVEAEHG